MIRLLKIIAGLFLITLAASSFHYKNKSFKPPGTVKINDTLFADEAEISNFYWVEYETYIKIKYGYHSPEHLAALPDTLVWREKMTYNEPYVQYYYRHPAYKDYPVVGISYEQAIAFCKWRSNRIKEFLCISKKYNAINFEYRLPTKKEWEFMSNNGGLCFLKAGKNEKGRVLFNHRWAKDSVEAKKGYQHAYPEVLAPVYSYWKNNFGLFNMIGNAGEMVLEKGISKGGSWRHLMEECRPGKDIAYTKPEPWLGFRCVCVIKKASLN